MKKMEYESPEFKFQEMRLLEKVADTCWGASYAWFDANGNGKNDSGEGVDLKGYFGNSGCNGDSARGILMELWGKLELKEGVSLESAVSTNSKGNNVVISGS